MLFNNSRTKLKTPDLSGDQPITCCAIDARGKIFAYALSYDWHKVRFYFIQLSHKELYRYWLHLHAWWLYLFWFNIENIFIFRLISRVTNTTIRTRKIQSTYSNAPSWNPRTVNLNWKLKYKLFKRACFVQALLCQTRCFFRDLDILCAHVEC